MSSGRAVLHVTPYYPPAWAFGDVPRRVEELARAQIERGHSVTVLTTDAMAPHERLPAGETVVDMVRVVRVPSVSSSLRIWLGWSTPIGLRRRARALLAEGRFDAVHVHELVTIETLRVVPVVPHTIPIVASLHGQLDQPGMMPAALLRLWCAGGGRSALDRVRALAVTTEEERRAIEARWPATFGSMLARPVHVVPVSGPLTSAETAARWDEVYGFDDRSVR